MRKQITAVLVVASLLTGNANAFADTQEQILAKIAQRQTKIEQQAATVQAEQQQFQAANPFTPEPTVQETDTTYVIPKGTCIRWGTVYKKSNIEPPCIKRSKRDRTIVMLAPVYAGSSQFENQLSKGVK